MKQQIFSFFFLLSLSAFSQASLVKDIQPGIISSSPNGLTVFNGNIYFAATTSGEGMELWKSDGTTAGTILLKDINPGANGSAPELLTPMLDGNIDVLHFVADNGALGRELWLSDGTTSGTLLLQDLHSGPQGSNISEIIDITSNFEYIIGDINTTTDFGVEMGTIIRGNGGGSLFITNEINVGSLDSNPEHVFKVGSGEFIYLAGQSPTLGIELYQKANLSQAFPSMVSDINPTGDSNPNHFITFNGKVYFSADDGTNGVVLFEIVPGVANSLTLIKTIETGEKVIFNNKMYFAANDATNGVELWESDGTGVGTQMVFNLNAGAASSNPSNFIVYNNRLYFTATNAGLGTELFYVTTGGNIINAANINPGSGSSNPSNLIEYNGKLHFTADDGTNGVELWETTGTALTTIMSADINTAGSSNPSGLVVLNNELFFAAFGNSSASGVELWKYKDPALSTEEFTTTQLEIYPNPVANTFQINSQEKINHVSIYDVQGKLIKHFNRHNASVYNIEALQKGLYLIKIKTENREVTKKLIKQ